jgi:hypothetical protein
MKEPAQDDIIDLPESDFAALEINRQLFEVDPVARDRMGRSIPAVP